MKKPLFLSLLLAVLLCITACGVTDQSGSKNRGEVSSVMENVERRSLESLSSVYESYDYFSEEQISEIQDKINRKEYSVIADTANLRAVVICDLDADGTADALVISLCYSGDSTASELDLYEVESGKMKIKKRMQNGGFDFNTGYEVECHDAFWEFDGLQVSADGHEVTAYDTINDVINSESCRFENGEFVFNELSVKEYEHNLTELYAVRYVAGLCISPGDYTEIKEYVKNKKPVIYDSPEDNYPTDNVVVCDIDDDGDFEAVVIGTMGSGMIYETFESFSLQNGNLLGEKAYYSYDDISNELAMGALASIDIGISENGTEIIFTLNNDTICVWVQNDEVIFSKNGEIV